MVPSHLGRCPEIDAHILPALLTTDGGGTRTKITAMSLFCHRGVMMTPYTAGDSRGSGSA